VGARQRWSLPGGKAIRTRSSKSIRSIAEGRGDATGGQRLRVLREKLELTMRDIETASERIARKRENEAEARKSNSSPLIGRLLCSLLCSDPLRENVIESLLSFNPSLNG